MRSMHLSLLAVALIPASTFASVLTRREICGARGYSTDVDAYYYNDDNSQATYKKCSKVCAKDPSGCKSFAFGDGTCMLFGVSAASNMAPDSESPYAFYESTCPDPSSTTTKATTTTTTTTTKTTTTTTTTTTTKTTTTTTKSTPTTTTTTTTTKPTTTTTTTKTTTSGATTTTTTTSTSKSQTTTTASSTTSGVVVPSGCNVPASYTVQSVNWFNSTHNLDCVTGPDVGDGTGCLDSNGQWCDPNLDKTCTHCGIAVCSTGLPPQAVGYGPPDSVTVTLSDSTSCTQVNPAGYRRREVGEGIVECGSAYPFLAFYGNSNGNTNTGTVHINAYPVTCKNGQSVIAQYEGSVNLKCSHDSGFNATCTSTGPAKIALVSVANQ